MVGGSLVGDGGGLVGGGGLGLEWLMMVWLVMVLVLWSVLGGLAHKWFLVLWLMMVLVLWLVVVLVQGWQVRFWDRKEKQETCKKKLGKMNGW